MITLFRKIRQKLIDSGSLTKYLLYATGEILLVVIGILIALQVNNWNEERALKNDLSNYLIKKIEDLHDDHEELQLIREYRIVLSEKSKAMLDSGLLNVGDEDLVDFITLVTVEKRFISSISRAQTTEINNYFKNIKEAKIRDLEIEYLNLVDVVSFSESRLNNFSENLEADLWRGGFFNDNRTLFDGVSNNLENLPDIILTEENGLKSLEAIIRRNEMINGRLATQYSGLMQLNQQLITVIEEYLNTN